MSDSFERSDDTRLFGFSPSPLRSGLTPYEPDSFLHAASAKCYDARDTAK